MRLGYALCAWGVNWSTINRCEGSTSSRGGVMCTIRMINQTFRIASSTGVLTIRLLRAECCLSTHLTPRQLYLKDGPSADRSRAEFDLSGEVSSFSGSSNRCYNDDEYRNRHGSELNHSQLIKLRRQGHSPCLIFGAGSFGVLTWDTIGHALAEATSFPQCHQDKRLSAVNW
jgi:hypothetical protein